MAVALAVALPSTAPALQGPVPFVYSGTEQSLRIPAGVYDAVGAAGGASRAVAGGGGGEASAAAITLSAVGMSGSEPPPAVTQAESLTQKLSAAALAAITTNAIKVKAARQATFIPD